MGATTKGFQSSGTVRELREKEWICWASGPARYHSIALQALSWIAAAVFATIPGYVCVLFGATLPTPTVWLWLQRIAMDLCLSLLVFNIMTIVCTCFVMWIWASVRRRVRNKQSVLPVVNQSKKSAKSISQKIAWSA